MLHIRVIAVGKLKERFWAQACDEYLKRLRPYASVEVVEMADMDPSKVGGEQKAIELESSAIMSALGSGQPSASSSSMSILLDIGGKQISSEEIARRFEDAPFEGINGIDFVIGGSCGVSAEVRRAVNLRWSLGRITLPHNLARVVLLEQIYRAFKILRHEPYHK